MFRVGIGYDVHKFGKGIPLVLGGIEIPFEFGLIGHSDGDVLTHSICDALLGALSLGDIGEHFPDTDESLKGISSLILLKEVANLISSKGYAIENLDSIIIAQEPKISPYKTAMRKKLSKILSIPLDSISIKATTTEGLGFEGRKEGISAQSIVLLRRVK